MSAEVLADTAAAAVVDAPPPPSVTTEATSDVETVVKTTLTNDPIMETPETSAATSNDGDQVKPDSVDAVTDKITEREVPNSDVCTAIAAGDTKNDTNTPATEIAATPIAEPVSSSNSSAPTASAGASVAEQAKVEVCKPLIDDDKKSVTTATAATSDSEDLAESESGAVTTVSVSITVFSLNRCKRYDYWGYENQLEKELL